MNEEATLQALFNLTANVRWARPTDAPDARSFVTTSRRVRLFSDVGAEQQPACFQAEWATQESQRVNQPYKTILEVNWIVFQCVARDPEAVGASENNLILRGIRAALAPQPSDRGFLDRRNTLGGLVYHCFITGKIFKDPGDLDSQGMMVVPIKVLVP